MADLLAHPQVRRLGGGRHRRLPRRTSQSHLPKGFRAKGDIFVFVDECHRTQSGKLHDAMKAILPDAMLIGFTGTPLLKSDKRRRIETFGPYIHTYKYDEAVRDGVVLDLRYEARDIDQSITSPGEGRPVVRAEDEGAHRRGPGPAQAALGDDAEGALRRVTGWRRSSPTS